MGTDCKPKIDRLLGAGRIIVVLLAGSVGKQCIATALLITGLLLIKFEILNIRAIPIYQVSNAHLFCTLPPFYIIGILVC
jgi:hypothetical protein